MHLINSTTKQPIKVGDQVETWAGSKVTVLSITEPHKPSSTGRMYVKGLVMHGEYFPSVFNCEWVKEVTA